MDHAERNRFVEQNIGLVHACCHRFAGRGAEYDDLFQAGSVGLIKAADGFDPARNVCFSTYAVPVILGEIRRLFREGGTVKVSRGLKERARRVGQVREELRTASGHEPTVSEIAQAADLTEAETAEAIGASMPPLSLTADRDEEGSTLADIPVDDREEVLDRLTQREIRGSLGERDWQLIGLRYFKGQTQTETARVLGMTQVQVSRRERAILEALRRKFA